MVDKTAALQYPIGLIDEASFSCYIVENLRGVEEGAVPMSIHVCVRRRKARHKGRLAIIYGSVS
jgi:hypothetical protein